ncbi:uncharacterized protein LOC108112076 [Drosophila eugracilis]|uniref:uncharacterized protein LOC108112076 n=1 Tax=Drosophila eugracilis TaxID=29029 RepID=UPI0007E76B91|nr:uncharacterized protein LOC108112076 [Drosophila eugracilis]
MVGLAVLLLCLGGTRSQFLDVTVQREKDFTEALSELLIQLHQGENYDTLLIYGEDCVFHSVSRSLAVPTVLVSSGSTDFDWGFNSQTLLLSCGPGEEREVNYRTLIKLQRNRRLIYLPKDTAPSSVCESYSQKEQYNVAMVREDFETTQKIYACRSFTQPNIQEIYLMENESIFIENFRNFHGKPIMAMADLVAPRSMVYLDKKTRERKLTGFVANLMNNFAQKINATLRFETLSFNVTFRDIVRKVKNDELDIGIFLEATVLTNGLDTASYPFLLTNYCLMLPVPAKMPFNRVYGIIVDRLVLVIMLVLFCLLSLLLIYSPKGSWRKLDLANIFLNDITLRGLLGQSFPFPPNASKHLKIIFCILCFASIMITTMYDAYLQSFFTNPPTDHEIRTFKDIGKYHQKIAIPEIEMTSLIITNNSQFGEINKEDLFVIDGWREYLTLRDTLNISYGYIVTEDRWSVFAEQQKLFKKPIFYFAKDLCFSRQLFMSIPLRKYLPYRHLFEDHMMRQQEFGMVKYWKSHSFFDMVRLGITPLKDLSPPTVLDASLLLQDISWILKIYLAAMVISIFCFLFEVLAARIGNHNLTT